MNRAPVRRQRGVVLFISLIILVAMTLAGIALMRSVDTGTIIAGNLAFRQNTTYVGDIGVEAARAWLTLPATTAALLQNDATGNGYYATWGVTTDLLGNDTDSLTTPFDWTASGPSINVTAAPFTPPAGYAVRYVIHRLCATVGDPSLGSATCVKAAATAASGTSGTQGAATYGSYALGSPVAAVYRVTVQVTGPRNSRSYIQSVVF